MVTVRMDGNKRVLGIVIEPDAVEDIEMLQDMVGEPSTRRAGGPKPRPSKELTA